VGHGVAVGYSVGDGPGGSHVGVGIQVGTGTGVKVGCGGHFVGHFPGTGQTSYHGVSTGSTVSLGVGVAVNVGVCVFVGILVSVGNGLLKNVGGSTLPGSNVATILEMKISNNKTHLPVMVTFLQSAAALRLDHLFLTSEAPTHATGLRYGAFVSETQNPTAY